VIFALPGMGADHTMYGPAWHGLPDSRFLDWPTHNGERTIAAIAARVIEEAEITDGAMVIGSSLGGIVACEIARLRQLRQLVLVGGAARKEEISPLLRLLHPLAPLAPIEFIQRAASKIPGEVTGMFNQAQASFIRAMSLAIFEWEGLDDARAKPLRIHGRHDHVIPLPPAVDLVLDGGHLIDMTHPEPCVAFILANGP